MLSSDVTGKELPPGRTGTCKGVLRWPPSTCQSCWPPKVLVVLSILGDPDLESPRARTPMLKERPLFSALTSGELPHCSSGDTGHPLLMAFVSSFLFKSMKELTFLVWNFSNRTWNLNMWAFSYALRIGFVCQKYFFIVCICLHVYFCSSMYNTHMHECQRTTFGS